MEPLLPLKALADRNRLRIVAALADYEELCACQLTELLGVSGATASRHLAQLTASGLLASRKDGRWVHYCLATPASPLHRRLLRCAGECFGDVELLKDVLDRLACGQCIR